MSITSLSKFLSLILRHKPEIIGIKLDAHGWAEVDELLKGINQSGRQIDFALLQKVVDENDKQRFSFNEYKTKIRANQGHSKKVDVDLQQKEPPKVLYHGTLARNIKSIEEKGLIKMNRLHVHLSGDIETAMKVATRRSGEEVIYKIDSEAMNRDGYKFFQSVNGVWLTDHVLPKYLSR